MSSSVTADNVVKAFGANTALDRVSFEATDANPLAGRRLDVEPGSAAARQVDAWWSTRPDDARALERIASRPQATWFGAWSGDPRTAVRDRVAAAASRGPSSAAPPAPAGSGRGTATQAASRPRAGARRA